MSKPIEIIIVGSRCVYINDYRVAGSKPYVSENLPHQTFHANLADILDAFALDDLQKAVDERLARRRHNRAKVSQ
jgi:hypothetical protein